MHWIVRLQRVGVMPDPCVFSTHHIIATLAFCLVLSMALPVVLFGRMVVAMLAEKGPSVGWRELVRHGGDEFFVYLACGVLLPFTLAIKRWQHRFLVVLVVATVSFFVYGRAFLLLGAGA
jgi:hypothetical protein